MIITRLEVRTAQGVLLNLPFESITNGVFIEAIEGLEPVKATLVSSSFAQMDGAQYHSSRREPRNIKLKLGLEPDYTRETVRDVRNNLYTFFMPKTEVSLRFILEGPGLADDYYVDILGRIESFDTPLFAQEPGVEINMICYDPDFINPIPVVYSGSSTSGTAEQALEYLGTVETGIKFTLRPARSVSAFTIYHRPPDGTLRTLDFSNPLVASDVLTIVTTMGRKSVTRNRTGFDTSLLYALSPQSQWLEFQPGVNYVRVYAEGAAIPYTIEYTTKYGGL